MSKRSELPEMITFDSRSSLEKALAFSIGEEKSKKCVESLLKRYGSISTVISENEEEICRVGGVNMNTSLLIKLIAYTHSRRVTDKFSFGREYNELELQALLSALFLGASIETVYAILIDKDGKVISTEFISEGTVNASDIIPRKILECANKKKAKGIILAHNHPKGSTAPSKEDIMTTGRLFNLFSSVGVRLVAHYIIADGEVGRIDTDMLYNPDYTGY